MTRNLVSPFKLLRRLRIGWLAVVGLAFATAGPFAYAPRWKPKVRRIWKRCTNVCCLSLSSPASCSPMRTSEAADWSSVFSTVASTG